MYLHEVFIGAKCGAKKCLTKKRIQIRTSALPSYSPIQWRSKTGEGVPNLETILERTLIINCICRWPAPPKLKLNLFPHPLMRRHLFWPPFMVYITWYNAHIVILNLCSIKWKIYLLKIMNYTLQVLTISLMHFAIL